MSTGKFSGGIQAAHTRSLQLIKVNWSTGIFVQGDRPEKSVIFATSVLNTMPSNFNNHNINSGEVILVHEGEEVNFLSSCSQDIQCTAVAKELLNRYSIALLGEEFDAIYAKNNRLYFKDESAKKIQYIDGTKHMNWHYHQSGISKKLILLTGLKRK